MDDRKLDDESLIQRISGKDPGAFEELVNRYKVSVYNTCYGFLGDRHQAEDASQEVFLQVYRSSGSFRGESRASTWIYRISVNRSLNLIRRSRRLRRMKSLSDVWDKLAGYKETEPGSREEEPDRLFEEKEKKDILQKIVDSLPAKQRASFVLSQCEALTSREISEILGISINSVEARIHRAKLSIQKKWLRHISGKKMKP